MLHEMPDPPPIRARTARNCVVRYAREFGKLFFCVNFRFVRFLTKRSTCFNLLFFCRAEIDSGVVFSILVRAVTFCRPN